MVNTKDISRSMKLRVLGAYWELRNIQKRMRSASLNLALMDCEAEKLPIDSNRRLLLEILHKKLMKKQFIVLLRFRKSRQLLTNAES